MPAQVTDRVELLRDLERFSPLIVVTQKTLLEKIAPLAGIGMLGLMAVFYVTTNKLISTCSGIIIMSLLTWSAWHIWRNKNMTQQARRALWFLPIVFLSILAATIARLLQ